MFHRKIRQVQSRNCAIRKLAESSSVFVSSIDTVQKSNASIELSAACSRLANRRLFGGRNIFNWPERVLFLEGFGQCLSGVRDTVRRPFASVCQLRNAAAELVIFNRDSRSTIARHKHAPFGARAALQTIYQYAQQTWRRQVLVLCSPSVRCRSGRAACFTDVPRPARGQVESQFHFYLSVGPNLPPVGEGRLPINVNLTRQHARPPRIR